jgi:GTP-binding protein LepA
MKNIRNFCIIAHIDHGKSTLADRFLELTKTVEKRDMKEQLLDQMELERERGITIKLAPVRMVWQPSSTKHEARNSKQILNSNDRKSQTISDFDIRISDLSGLKYILNLIDTPGHVDFSYEVSRSLAAVEGAILIVDATQGIEAQTLSTLYAAMEHDLTIIPVINKIDLAAAKTDEVRAEIVKLLGCNEEEILEVSAKTGEGVENLLDAIVDKIPPPLSALAPRSLGEVGSSPHQSATPTRALIFDSIYDKFRGVVAYVRVVSGEINDHDEIFLMQTKTSGRVEEVGILTPKFRAHSPLSAGEIGYIVTGFREVAEASVGDTVTGKINAAPTPLPGYKNVTPYVYASIFCSDSNDYPELAEAIKKLKLNDAALSFEPQRSDMLGFGFRCGFLGLLHMDIVRERLEREYNLDLVVTSPTVIYKVKGKRGEEKSIERPSDFSPALDDTVLEPWADLEVVTSSSYIGSVMELAQQKRAIYKNTEYLDAERVILKYTIPLSELIIDFYDKLKSISQGYASINYKIGEYEEARLERIDILIAEEKIDALSVILHHTKAEKEGRRIVEKLKELIPRQNFEVKIQAAIGARIIAASRIPAMRKDVTAKLYGGDVTRKNKLLDKQKKGKKKMKQIGKVELPSDIYIKVLKD